MEAALALVPLTPKKIINHPTTRSQPEGFTCLHFASEGSDKVYERARLVRALVERQANVEARTTTGNTPLLLASGTGVAMAETALQGDSGSQPSEEATAQI